VPKDAYEGAMKQLCNPKFKVLMKNPNKPVFKDTDQIKINLMFKSPTIRLNLMPVKMIKK